MSEHNIRGLLKSCLGKSRYPSEERALKFAKKAMKERQVVLRVYACNTCQGFHLTSKPKAAPHE